MTSTTSGRYSNGTQDETLVLLYRVTRVKKMTSRHKTSSCGVEITRVSSVGNNDRRLVPEKEMDGKLLEVQTPEAMKFAMTNWIRALAAVTRIDLGKVYKMGN
ncbi:hypothetical protein VTL71DRAFT_4202, partial [Oculimacula yallundae]